MENFKVIELQEARDFSRKMNATFEFIKQNFKSLSKSLLFIAGPPALIGSMFLGSFFGKFMSIAQQSAREARGNPQELLNYYSSGDFWMQMLLMIVCMVITSVMVVATINGYIVLYHEKRTNKIDINEVWAYVRKTFWMYFSTFFAFGFFVMIAYLVLVIPIVILAAISPFLIFFGVLFFIFAVFYLLFSFSLVFFIRGFEGIGFFDALGRSFKLVRGKWWSTFGLIMILYMIVSIVSYIPLIPWYVMTLVNALHSMEGQGFQEPSSTMEIMTTVMFAIYYLLVILLGALPNVGIAFQYFNLVELKESKGLMEKIESLGQTPTPPAQEEHY